MDDKLLDYLLNQLEPEPARALEAELATRPELRDRLERMRRVLAPLDDLAPAEPPPGLAEATLQRVAAHPELPPAPRRPLSPASDPDRRASRWIDWVVAASVLLLVGGLGVAWLGRTWADAHVTACKKNLAAQWMALAQYGQQHHGALPAVQERPGPQGVAAGYLPALFDAGVVAEPLAVGCPGRGPKTIQACGLQPLEQLAGEDPERLRQRMRELGGDYAYSLGYRDNGRLCGLRLDSGAEVPILADAPPPTGQGNSPNHGGRGQNVAFIGGHVRWLPAPAAGAQADEIYLNRLRRIQAGLDSADFVLGAGDAQAGP